MTDRQYGVLPGASIDGTPPQQQFGKRTSPTRQYTQQASKRTMQSADMQKPPPPPVHRSKPPQIRSSLMPIPLPQPMGNTSDISEYQPSNPFRDIDNLYNPAMRTPSPVRYNPRHRSPPSSPGVRETHPSEHSPAPTMWQPTSTGPRSPSPTRSSVRSPYQDPARAELSAPSLIPHEYYHGDGYDDFDPNGIADDGDDYAEEHTQRSRSRLRGASAGVPTFLRPFGANKTSGQYGPLPAANPSNDQPFYSEKTPWSNKDHEAVQRRRRKIWIICAIVFLLVAIGAITGGVLGSRNKSSSKSTTSSSSSTAASHSGGLFDIDSSEVQQLMNNQDLHKVFPAMDYTPLNAQYPDCLSNPPDQNNVTLDVAMLSQLSPAIRLYGTDCNQTEMVLTAIDRLKMNDTMSIWLGVWLGTNTTTNNRQLAQMYDILDKYPASHFAGVIVGNEVLFRKDMTLTQLSTVLTQVRSNFTTKKISLPVATSDLGDNWTADLALASDIVMANVHPFFAGVTPDVAPGWTYNFWQSHDAKLTTAKTGSWPKSIISEVGWPSQGAVASIDNMNKFMDGFVCQSMTNGTTYFWFEAFDEPWKVIYETGTDGWESHWGLIDINRNLKSGVKIPDCGGKSLSKPY
ncbi:hypothetical protein AMS68_000868 [Peltaster fructicola]|uniref:glucan endo-1,3-beta-D-glucosidase n=1 Tax=Peltaster fructicola TaxID=286661 RepID=A0A6H0XL43_9PEZI|nr:hypothetical protein AMS68_000868 [Peltaster fructicola]